MRTGSSSRPAPGRRVGVLGLAGVALCLAPLALGERGAARQTPSQPGARPEASPPASIPASRDLWGQSFGGERAFTQPKQDAAMGFTLSTQVMEVACRTGDRVTAGQLLIRGDDREEASRYAQQLHRAESTLQIERARAAAALAQVEFEKFEESLQSGGVNELEYDRARLARDTANIDVQIAEWSQQQERYLAELTKARLDRFHLVAPFDGVIDIVNVDAGDAVRETDPVVRVVDLSELWIDAPTPPEQVTGLGLRSGSDAWVLIELADRPMVVRGRVLSVSPTSDFGASKRRVRVAVENPDEWPSGLVAWVRFTEPEEQWRELVPEPAPSVTLAEPRVAPPPHAGEEGGR